ncbi:DUF1232 domain-containing protein [Nibricoccus sp. IMCC34717]|uniref:DUF1232 domain-containing protein n=1 Tax=Nibricoccus sp. IMCC34717 TaxID=3034021 RepID=UPI003850270A
MTLESGPDALSRFITRGPSLTKHSTSDFVEAGSRLVNAATVDHLRGLLLFLHEKTAAIKDSRRLATRVDLLTCYFEEKSAGVHLVLDGCMRETTFGLLYFLKGYDQIPDSVPDIGLLDDAVIIEVVLRRNESDLRQHWAKLGRTWPEEA